MSTPIDTDHNEPTANFVEQSENATGWTNCLGFPEIRPEIKRILCLKFDHIGDILVSDFAFRLLRKYFPAAEITLICGEWNTELARVLQIADVIIGVSLFHQQGALQHDETIAAAARKSGVTRLMQIAQSQPLFDMAIDMRIDEDTRDLLKLFKARVYVGSGHLSKFPFLDIAVPQSETHLNKAPDRFRLMPKDFITTSGFEISSYGVGFASALLSIPIKFEVSGARTPIECGTSTIDNRKLAVAIRSINVICEDAKGNSVSTREFTFTENSPDCQFLSQGWAIAEEWGTWGIESEMTIVLSLRNPISLKITSVDIFLRAHTNPENKLVSVKVYDLTSNFVAEQQCEFPASEFHIVLPVQGSQHFGFARTRPVTLRAGRYLIHVETFSIDHTIAQGINLSVVGTIPERTIVSYRIRLPQGANPRNTHRFEFQHRDSDEAVQFQMENGENCNPDGLYLVALSSTLVQAAPARVPASHMEKLIARLVIAAALEFSTDFSPFLAAAEEQFRLKSLSEIRRQDDVVGRYLQEIATKKDAFKIVGMGIGATKETKRWPFGYILELCENLLDRNDVFLVLVGGPQDVEDTRRLENSLTRPDRVINVCGNTKLAEFSSIASSFDLYLGFDTGTTHYAGKVGVRTIGIFAAVHSPREWGPVGRRASWITRYTDCSPCYLARLDDCRYGHACMLELLPIDCMKVIAKALDEICQSGDCEEHLLAPIETPAINHNVRQTSRNFGDLRYRESRDVAPSDLDQQIVFKVNHTYRAGIDDAFSSAFIQGWHAPEAEGIWCSSLGHARFAVAPERGELLEFEFHSRVLITTEAPRIHISIDGFEHVIQFSSEIWITNRIQLRPKGLGSIAIVEMIFRCPNARTPNATDVNADDQRELGLMISSFTFTQA